jgi:tetratricopeptide (TPR) repeat protein
VLEIQAELDNIRLAVQSMLGRGAAARLRPVLHTLGQYYQCRRSRGEGERVFASVVSAFEPLLSDEAPDVRRTLGLALIYQALFCDQLGRKRVAMELVTRSVELLGAAEPTADYGMALVMYAYACAGVADPADVVARLEQGIALHRALGEGWWLIRGLVVSTRVYVGVVGDLAKAEACLRECISLQKSLGDGAIFYPDSLAALGLIRSAQGHAREGCELMLESLRSAERSDDAWATLLALQFAARAHRDLGDYSAAEVFVRRCIVHARELGSVETVAWCHLTLGSVLREQGRLEEASARYRQGAEQSEGEPALIAKAELGLGELALQRGDHGTAQQHLEKSLGICEQHRIRGGLRAALEALGYLACEEARHDDARAHFLRAFELARARQKPAALLGVIVGVAWWCARSGRPARAAELASLAQHHPATTHPVLARRVLPLLAELSGTLGSADLDAALARGESAPLDGVFAASFP